MFNIIKQKLPFSNDGIKIETDFRKCLEYESIVRDDSFTSEEKLSLVLQLFFGKEIVSEITVDDLDSKIETVFWLYDAKDLFQGKRVKAKEDKEEKEEEKDAIRKKAVFDFEYDSQMIFSDFLREYQIDLNDVAFLHWWKFLILLFNLSDESQFKTAIKYRSMKIDAKMSQEEKSRILSLKKIYAIPDTRTREEKEAELAEQLW